MTPLTFGDREHVRRLHEIANAAAIPRGDERCPCCAVTILSPFTTTRYMGQDICFVCADGMDTEDARRNISRSLDRVTLRLTPRDEP